MSPTEGLIIKVWYISTKETITQFKKKIKCTGKREVLETLILSEVSRAQEDKHHMFYVIGGC